MSSSGQNREKILKFYYNTKNNQQFYYQRKSYFLKDNSFTQCINVKINILVKRLNAIF